MPLLGTLLAWIAGKFTALMIFMKGSAIAIRINGLLFVATIYVACVVTYTNIISDWISNVFNTSYGVLLGLLFPPVSGSVLASLGMYWTCVIGVRYISSLTKAAIK